MIELRGVSKAYETTAGPAEALRAIDLSIAAGEYVAITGRSGSGKSTLLNLIAGIDQPSAGDIVVAGQALQHASEAAMARWRGATVGVVFQFFQLIPTLTVAENVMLPMDFLGKHPRTSRRSRALELLERVDIASLADRFPATLSGGQQQRVAIARALANDPRIVTADEPTGNLDTQTADSVLRLFQSIAQQGTTVVIATHERDIARLVDRTVEIENGALIAVRQ